MFSRRLTFMLLVVLSTACQRLAEAPAQEGLRINELQFVGSHNSYKKAMSTRHRQALQQSNPQAAAALDYAHIPLQDQLDLGLRKLELDIFVSPSGGDFTVGHVQVIDMNSHCDTLSQCLQQVRQWSDTHPSHVPIWISFNAKDATLEGLPDPLPFTGEIFDQLDQLLEAMLGDRLIRPRDIVNLQWPTIDQARGKVLLILDEQGPKRTMYLQAWQNRPMFTNVPAEHPAAAIMIINDPIAEQDNITRLVRQGFMVRTRADADTLEARRGDTRRREAAFASGAQAISTDYYLPANPFGTDYTVQLPGRVRCNPVLTTPPCSIAE
ncbi:MAG: Ca2+-dependent phosphoinositide-specific phospholipase C [bacterium]